MRCGCNGAAECGCAVGVSDCVAMSGVGSVGDPFVPVLLLSEDVNNAAECRDDGLYVPVGPQLIDEEIPVVDVASVTFPSIPQTPFRHLELRFAVRGSQAAVASTFNLRFNGDTGSNYAYQLMYAFNATAAGVAGDTQTMTFLADVAANTATANRVGHGVTSIFDYARTNWHKTVSTQSGDIPNATANDFRSMAIAGLWKSTAAITSLTLLLGSGNIKAGSIFSLYGVP